VTGPLHGRRVLVTRERPGELAEKLTARGAEVVHVPLIEVVGPDDGGTALGRELDRLDGYDWLIVTSPAGAERVGAAAARHPGVHLAAVGTATAAALRTASGRECDLVPGVQRADALAEELVARSVGPQRILVAHADRAATTMGDLLRAGGHDVVDVIAYRTLDVEPGREVQRLVHGADAVVFASGSAVQSWCRTIGLRRPPVVVVIGPTTAGVAHRLGLEITSVAVEHSLDGLVDALVAEFDPTTS